MQVREANQMVEEMMLLANVTVAEVTLRGFPACAILRRHPAPAPRQFEPLMQVAAATGITIDTSSSKVRGPASCAEWLLNCFRSHGARCGVRQCMSHLLRLGVVMA